MTGPNKNYTSVDAETLVIGGTLYELDGTIDESGASVTYNLNGSYKQVIIIERPENPGHDQLQVNGQTSGYTSVDSSDTETTSLSEWPINGAWEREYIHLRKRIGIDDIGLRLSIAGGGTGLAVRGEANAGGATADIDSITFLDSGATSQTIKARVYGRVV